MKKKELKKRLDIIETNISDLVDHLDENRLFSNPIVEPLWKYILAIEKVIYLKRGKTK
jgi:hypothetical protein